MPNINDGLYKQLKSHFKNREFGEPPYCTSCYIQLLTPIKDENIHYEYLIEKDEEGCIELHFEGENWKQKYDGIIEELYNRTQHNNDLLWENWEYGYRCKYIKKIENLKDLIDHLTVFMNIFDDILKENIAGHTITSTRFLEIKDSFVSQQDNVSIQEKNLEDVLSLPLSIPNYQRIYCWEEKNVKCLLDDIFDHIENQEKNKVPYRLGVIILHSNNGKYDIIDGQQRLITLSLLMNEMGIYSNLMDEKLISRKSLEFVAYNKHLISLYIKRRVHNKYDQAEKILELLEFSVLVLKNSSLDLAYTFFSNQNSRGVELTDYDLLKAHHLRYIPQTFEQQSKRAAQVWNKMIENGRVQENGELSDYIKTLDIYMYRLRKWMRKKDCLDSTVRYRIKQEYEAAPIIDEIPPFGERFYFNEPIQGGTHFFSFVEQHLDKYHQFIQTNEYQLLHNNMVGHSHQWYRDAIESILFGYFLKFGTFYFSDTLVVIMRIILQNRYFSKRAHKGAIEKYVRDTELILIIDQATSVTFFLAEARNIAKELDYPTPKDMSPIQKRMRNIAYNISIQLEKNIIVNSFKDLNI